MLVVALLWIGQMFFAEPFVTAALQSGLERANGATVDVDSAELDLRKGRLTVHGLAMADSLVYATARRFEATLVTGDADFQGLPGTVVVR